MTDIFDSATEAKRDRYGRYLLPDPNGKAKKELAWTRATTFARSIADTFGLTQWELRMVAKGISMRRDLYALAASADIEDKDKLNQVARDAKEAAAASSGANLGTALHAFTEQVDRGEQVNPPEPWNRDIDAYRAAMAAEKVTPVAEWIERIVVVPELKVAGTLDRIVRLADGRLVIADVKTGKDLSYSWGEIAVQLALYANATAMWNRARNVYEPMPAVDKTFAIVMHIPAGKAACTLHRVDITAGWEAATLCQQVRLWRARRDLATGYASPIPDPLARIERSNTANALTAAIKAAQTVGDLEALWATASQAGTWTTAHTAAAGARKHQLLAPTGA